MIVVIAEKGSQAKELAAVLLPNGYQTGRYALVGKNGDGGDLVIVVARGHLYRLAEPHEYDPELKPWRKETLPWLPEELRYLPVDMERDRIESINSWLRRPNLTEVIHACDPDREGQMIGNDILKFSGIDSAVKVTRFWSNSMVPADIVDRWEQRRLNSDEEYENLYTIGNCRREMDKILGYNGTRWLCLDAREKGHSFEQIYSFGRVQTTTLAFIIDRERERAAFKSKQFFVVAARFRHDQYPSEDNLVAAWRPPVYYESADGDKRLYDKNMGLKIAAEVTNLPGRIRTVEREQLHDRPPLPHEMVSLQQEASTRWGLTSSQTMAAAQTLYDRGIISYPGTASRKLPETLIPRVPEILQAIAATHSGLARLIPHTKVEYAIDVFVPATDLGNSHSAIIPTTKVLAPTDPSWTKHEKWIYDIVARTFVANLMADKIRTRVSVAFDVVGHVFDASRSYTKTIGWQAALPPRKEDPDLQPLSQFWSQITTDEPVFCEEAGVVERHTQPPSRFTEASLLEEMKNAHKRVSDDIDRVSLQKAEGLGTARTRGDIIDSLVERNLVDRTGYEKRSAKLSSTQAGRDEIDSLPVLMRVAGFTARTETLMLEMRETGDEQTFREAAHDICRRFINEVKFVRPKPVDNNDKTSTGSGIKPNVKKKKAGSGGFTRPIEVKRAGGRKSLQSGHGRR